MSFGQVEKLCRLNPTDDTHRIADLRPGVLDGEIPRWWRRDAFNREDSVITHPRCQRRNVTTGMLDVVSACGAEEGAPLANLTADKLVVLSGRVVLSARVFPRDEVLILRFKRQLGGLVEGPGSEALPGGDRPALPERQQRDGVRGAGVVSLDVLGERRL